MVTIIDDILDMMDDMLDNASSVPFSVKKSIIDCDQMRDYINEIRLNLPQEAAAPEPVNSRNTSAETQ